MSNNVMFRNHTTMPANVTSLAELPAYNPDDENHYDFHLELCRLADIDGDGALCRIELAKVHQYFNVAFALWHFSNQCPIMSDSEKAQAIADTESRLNCPLEFFNCCTASADEFRALTRWQFRSTVPFADYIKNLGWKKETAASTD